MAGRPACVLPAASRIFVTQWLAFRKSGGTTKESSAEAVRLNPWNSAYMGLLGDYYIVQDQDASALPYLQKAARLHSLSARHWLDLAAARLRLG
jgi:hypothetical protein